MEKSCLNCKKVFKCKPSRPDIKCCSLQCKTIFRTILKVCDVCCINFRVKKSHSNKNRKCCSKKCQNINQKKQVGEKNNNYKDGKWIGKHNGKARRILFNACKKIKTHTTQEWNSLKIKYNFQCACCKIKEPKIKLTRDHIVPISKNGDDGINNIQPLCQRCNSKKSSKIITYYHQLKMDYLIA